MGDVRGDGGFVSDSFSTDDLGDTDGEAEPSDMDVGADVSLAESSKSSSELVPLSSTPSFRSALRLRPRRFGVRRESSDNDTPTMARVDDQVCANGFLDTTGPSGVSGSVVDIWGIGRPPYVDG